MRPTLDQLMEVLDKQSATALMEAHTALAVELREVKDQLAAEKASAPTAALVQYRLLLFCALF